MNKADKKGSHHLHIALTTEQCRLPLDNCKEIYCILLYI